jgi:hypothetical protein
LLVVRVVLAKRFVDARRLWAGARWQALVVQPQVAEQRCWQALVEPQVSLLLGTSKVHLMGQQQPQTALRGKGLLQVDQDFATTVWYSPHQILWHSFKVPAPAAKDTTTSRGGGVFRLFMVAVAVVLLMPLLLLLSVQFSSVLSHSERAHRHRVCQPQQQGTG